MSFEKVCVKSGVGLWSEVDPAEEVMLGRRWTSDWGECVHPQGILQSAFAFVISNSNPYWAFRFA